MRVEWESRRKCDKSASNRLQRQAQILSLRGWLYRFVVTWFMSRLGQAFPFLTTCKDQQAARVLRWLRCHSSYLAPGKGLGLAALAAAVLRGMFVSLMILVQLFIAVVYSLSAKIYPVVTWLQAWERPDGFPLLSAAGVIVIVLLLGVFIVYAYALSSVNIRRQYFDERREVHVWLGRILIIGVTLIALGLVPAVYDWLQNTFQIWWQYCFATAGLSHVPAQLSPGLLVAQPRQTGMHEIF